MILEKLGWEPSIRLRDVLEKITADQNRLPLGPKAINIQLF